MESEFFGQWIVRLKRFLVYPASSLTGWSLYVLVASLIFTFAYWGLDASVECETCGRRDWKQGLLSLITDWRDLLHYWSEVMRTSMSIDLVGRVKDGYEGTESSGFWMYMTGLLHLAVSYLFFGLLISMLYRKVTRG